MGDTAKMSAGQAIANDCTFSDDGDVGAVGDSTVDSLHAASSDTAQTTVRQREETDDDVGPADVKEPRWYPSGLSESTLDGWPEPGWESP